jgi:S1-C subfamily serine protease
LADSAKHTARSGDEVDEVERRQHVEFTVATTAFAIPVSKIVPIVEKMLAGTSGNGISIGETAFLGVATLDSSNNGGPGMPFDSSTSLTGEEGVVVQQVINGSPAAKAGIVAGDVITAFDGTTISTEAKLKDLIVEHRPGTTVSVIFTTQNGSSTTVRLQLIEGPVA